MKHAWSAIILGIVITLIGFNTLSFRKHPQDVLGAGVIGFLLRVAGPLVIAYGVLFLLYVLGGGLP